MTANTRESDVYSYGVVLLQLITRRKAFNPSFMEGIDIVVWVKSLLWATGDIDKIVDLSLAIEVSNSNVHEQVTKVLLVALRCTENDPHMRATAFHGYLYQHESEIEKLNQIPSEIFQTLINSLPASDRDILKIALQDIAPEIANRFLGLF